MRRPPAVVINEPNSALSAPIFIGGGEQFVGASHDASLLGTLQMEANANTDDRRKQDS